MMNVFLLDFFTRLQSWHDLRKHTKTLDPLDRYVAIDKWWQHAPQVTHYLHPDFVPEWPDPWELLNENTYCPYARGLGMIYTLILLGEQDLAMIEATDDNSEDVVLVLADNAKYVLNYWPDTVVNNLLGNFTVKRQLDISPLYKKIV